MFLFINSLSIISLRKQITLNFKCKRLFRLFRSYLKVTSVLLTTSMLLYKTSAVKTRNCESFKYAMIGDIYSCVSVSVTAWFNQVGRSIISPGAFQYSLLIPHGAKFHQLLNISFPFHLLGHLFTEIRGQAAQIGKQQKVQRKQKISSLWGNICGS